MDKLKNRLKYFFIGLSIGVMFVYFTFGNRGCEWLPENKVKNMVGEKEIIVGDSVLDIMTCLNITNDDIYDLLKENGEVEFSKSITNEYPKVYYIEAEKNEVLYWAKFALYDEEKIAEVVEVHLDGNHTCTSSNSNNYKSTIPLPHADVISILESHQFRILEKAECQMEIYNIEEAEIFEFHKTATINIKLSNPRLTPNPYYILEGEINGTPYSVKYIVGENRTRINSVVGVEKTDCQ